MLRAHQQRTAALVEHHIVEQHLIAPVLDIVGRAQAKVADLAHRPAGLVRGIAIALGRLGAPERGEHQQERGKAQALVNGSGAASHRRRIFLPLRVNSP